MVKNWNTDESNNSGIDAFYTGTVKFTGDTRLILADGARMGVGTATTPSTGNGIFTLYGSLTIYAQSTGPDMGQLNLYTVDEYGCINSFSSSSDCGITINGGKITCNANNGYGFYSQSNDAKSSIIINGGKIICNANNGFCFDTRAFYANSSIVINGGTIDCSGSISDALYASCNYSVSTIEINDGTLDLHDCSHGIYVFSGSGTGSRSILAINGGKVKDSSTDGFYVRSYSGVADITLGWKNSDDYIYTKNFGADRSVSIVDGQYLMVCGSADGSGTAYNGTLDGDDINAIAGHYLRPAMYTISAPENCNLSVDDNVGTVDPVTVGSGDNAKTYYLYDPDNTVTASLKNESFVTNYLIKNTGDNPVNVNIVGVGSASGVEGVNAVAFTMTDQDLKIVNNGLRLPTTHSKYLAFVDNIANVTTDLSKYTILVFDKLQKTDNPPSIEAVFKVVDEVPEDLPVIFAKNPIGGTMTDPIPVAEDNSSSANTLADEIRQAASPLFMTGTAGQTVADVLTAALTDAAGNPLLDSNNLPLSLNAADYVIFLFDANKFVPVAASATSKLTGRRYLLAVDKVTLLQLLNGGASAARSRAASATDGLTAASGRVWTFPLILGNDATGISSMFNVQSSMDTWFTIDGRRLQNRPAHKGIYIRNGEKVVVR